MNARLLYIKSNFWFKRDQAVAIAVEFASMQTALVDFIRSPSGRKDGLQSLIPKRKERKAELSSPFECHKVVSTYQS